MGKKTIVIGAGLGGLSAAIRLAADGHNVTILEKNERAGGKLNKRSGQGFNFDTGPSILTMPWVLEKLFSSAGRNVSDYMTIKRIEPQWRTFFEDGAQIDVTSDIAVMLSEVHKRSEKDYSNFLSYLDYCKTMFDLSLKSFYKKSLSGIQDLQKLHTFKDLLTMNPMKSMSQATEKYLDDKHLQQLFNFFIMYIGSSPYHSPAILSQLVYVQLGLGIYYVEGGMYNIAEGMLKLLDELGVDVQVNTEVAEILTVNKKAAGVKLASGHTMEADLVVSNLEGIPAHETLLKGEPGAEKVKNDLKKYTPTVSGLVLLLGVNKTFDHLEHHNFFFSKDPELEFKQIFDEGIPADDPTVYIGVSSKSDPSQAPEGKENLFVLTHVPPLQPGESFEEYRGKYREIVLDKLERMGMTGLRESIEFEYQFIPDDIRDLYGSNGGSIYGVATDRKVNGGFKIPSRSSLVDNLYFVGGSTHPGGGVPMVTLSGQLTADLIAEDQKLKDEQTG
ncbi:phytoene desaturase family protein [Alkalihalobacillus macyae]|uniref:phytoene desaturase family protein n=1 Tax=Guptibacillus hwajinpoensis TaxID=208199 RepID=UPI00273A9C4A|nr:phytoene desaturase family protein [Alkalihalobacillus macyae]MDP4550076.1 phytoene desaturase family protein [Alkalihalobacillus macyae]